MDHIPGSQVDSTPSGYRAEEDVVHHDRWDGVLRAITNDLKPANLTKSFLIIGTGHDNWCQPRWLNPESAEWRGATLSRRCQNLSAGILCVHATHHNLPHILTKLAIPEELGIAIFDQPGENFRNWLSLLRHGVRPAVVVSVFNAFVPATDDRVYSSSAEESVPGSVLFGASALALQRLGRRFGYTLVAVHSTHPLLYFVADGLVQNLRGAGNVDSVERMMKSRRFVPHLSPALSAALPDILSDSAASADPDWWESEEAMAETGEESGERGEGGWAEGGELWGAQTAWWDDAYGEVRVEEQRMGPAGAERLRRLQESCGEICNASIPGHPSLFFPRVVKHVPCQALWASPDVDAGRDSAARGGTGGLSIPAGWEGVFSLGGRVAIRPAPSGNADQAYLGVKTVRWTAEMVETERRLCLQNAFTDGYPEKRLGLVMEGIRQMPTVPGGRVLVVGSELPWLEGCLLAAGAAHVTTVEYADIDAKHPQLTTLTPDQARAAFAAGELANFDAIASFSSVEHSGLGRYGDAFNLWGDFQAVARAWCVTKPGGHMLLGVPTLDNDADSLMWNFHRYYGSFWYSHLTANWDQVWQSRLHPTEEWHWLRPGVVTEERQRVRVFRKPDTARSS